MINNDIDYLKTNNNRKIKRVIILCLIVVIYLLVFIPLFLNTIIKPSYQSLLSENCFDDVGALSESEQSYVSSSLKSVSQTNKVNIFLSICKRNYHKKYNSYLKEYVNDYDENAWASQTGTSFLDKYGLSENQNIIVIIVNCDAEVSRWDNETIIYSDFHFDLYTYGASARRITNNEINKILYSDAGDRILEGKSYVANAVCDMSVLLGDAYSHIYYSGHWWFAVIALIVSLIIAGFVYKKIQNSYKKDRKNINYSLSNNSRLNLTLKKDDFIYSDTTYTIIETSSYSGGSSSSSSSSGSSGGGGGSGHRGGR